MSEKLTPDEIATLSEKIAGFAASLSDRERDAFSTALWNGETADVEGFRMEGNKVGSNFADLKFKTGSSALMFPSIKHQDPIKLKDPDPWE